MKKYLIAGVCGLALMFGASISGVAQGRANFAGIWTLDAKKTDEVPASLKNYTLTVKQDEQHISFEAKVDGEMNPSAEQSARPNYLSTAETPSHATVGGGAGVATSSTGDAHTSGGNSRPVILARGRALATVIRRVSCRLDGQEQSREIGGASPGKIRRKAEWKKDKQVLELDLARDFNVEGATRTATIKEVWELADGGKTLKIKRTVNLLAGWDETTLYFNRQ